MSNFKRVILSLMIVAVATSAVGCRPEQVALSIIGLSVLHQAIHSQRDYDNLPRRPRMVPYYSYCSQYSAPMYSVYASPYGYYMVYQGNYYRLECMGTNKQSPPEQISSEQVADLFETDAQTAEYILGVLKSAQDGEGSALQQLGLSQDDMQKLSRLQMLSEEGIARVGAILKHESREVTVRVIEKLLETGRAMKQAQEQRNSA